MRFVALLSVVGLLGGCGQMAAGPAEPVGKYVIYPTPEVVGSYRINTVSGDTWLLIESTTEIMPSGGVTSNGNPLVWRKINTSTGN